jgi:hypothetical protein
MEYIQYDACSDRGHFGSSVHLIKLCLNFVEKGHVLEIVRFTVCYKITCLKDALYQVTCYQ